MPTPAQLTRPLRGKGTSEAAFSNTDESWDGEVTLQAWYVRDRERDLARAWRGSEVGTRR